ncbi:MAG: hypothetical protein JSU73_06940 [candidate division WOR-3 bacterium]|nr:MAG: hypothetical protein JSU73_06940 [candidate division WOR-3 bacterium]
MDVAILLLVSGLSFDSEFGIGGDYSTQAYRLLSYEYDSTGYEIIETERETLDLEPAGRTFLTVNMNTRGRSASFDASNTFSFTTSSWRNSLSLDLEQKLNPDLVLRAAGSSEGRIYHTIFPSLADTFYARDHLNNQARLESEWSLTDRFRIGLQDQAEYQLYARPDSFNYNYILNQLRADALWELGILSSVDAEYSWSRRWVTSDPGQDYTEHSGRLGADHLFGTDFSLSVSEEISRRAYPDPDRSYWEQNSDIGIGFDTDAFDVGVENEAGWTWYDSVTDVYSSMFENSTELEFEVQPWTALTVRFGPGYEFGNTIAGSSEDEYREWSGLVGMDIFILDRFLASAEDRIGRRRYPHADTTFQSDFLFNELTLFMNWTLLSGSPGSLGLEAMASILPEWHARSNDNFTLGIYTLELKYGF